MSSPVVDFQYHTGAAGVTSLNFNVTTLAFYDIILLQIGMENASSLTTVTSVTNNKGLGFHKINPEGIPGVVTQTSCISGVSGTTNVSMEIWAAFAPNEDTYNITINVSQSSGVTVLVTGVTPTPGGTYGPAVFDPGTMPQIGSNPGVNNANYNLPMSVTTVLPDDLLIIGAAWNISSQGPSSLSGYTAYGTWAGAGLDNITFTQAVSSSGVQAATLAMGQQLSVASGMVAIMYAITADAGGVAGAGCGPVIPLPGAID